MRLSLSCQQQLRERERARASERERERYLIEVVGLIDEQLNLLPPFQHLCHIFCACVCACECNVCALDRCSSGDIGERADSFDTPSAYHQHQTQMRTCVHVIQPLKLFWVVKSMGCCCARGGLQLLSHSKEREALLVVCAVVVREWRSLCCRTATLVSRHVLYIYTHTNINGACVGLRLTIYKDNDNTHICTYMCVHVCMHVFVRVCV